MKEYILLIIFTVGFFSCKKDTTENACQNSNLIRQIKSGNSSVHELTYNSHCGIHESIELFAYKQYEYDTQDRLVKLEESLLLDPTSCYIPPNSEGMSFKDPKKAPIAQYSLFEYDSIGRLVKKSNYFNNSGTAKLISYNTYEYTNNQISKMNIVNPESQITQYHTYEYDENGNVLKDDYYIVENGRDLKLMYSTISEFDNKNNPFMVFTGEGNPGIFTNKNNIIKKTNVSYSDGTENRYTVQYIFEYNNSGYPIKADGMDYLYGE